MNINDNNLFYTQSNNCELWYDERHRLVHLKCGRYEEFMSYEDNSKYPAHYENNNGVIWDRNK